jgi:hypothetical protein
MIHASQPYSDSGQNQVSVRPRTRLHYRAFSPCVLPQARGDRSVVVGDIPDEHVLIGG